MDLRFLFERGITPSRVAEVADVDHSTAWRWSKGKDCDSYTAVARLHAHGLLTDGDLRANGLAIPLTAPAVVDAPAPAPASDEAKAS